MPFTRALLCSLTAVLLMNTSVKSTPAEGSLVRQMLLGHTDDHFYTLQLQRTNPGTHYAYYDSTFLCKYSLEDGELKERHLLRATHYVDSAASGVWMEREMTAAAVPFHDLLARDSVKYLFNRNPFGRYETRLDDAGLHLERGGRPALVPLPLPADCELLQLHAAFLGETHYFLLIGCQDGSGYDRELVLALTRESVDAIIAAALGR